MKKIIIRCSRKHRILKIAYKFKSLFYIELWDDMKKARISYGIKQDEKYLFTI